MKATFSVFAALLIASFTFNVSAEDGVPSRTKLSKLGLGSLQVSSDEAGNEVRGSALAVVGGQFYAGTGAPGFGIFGAYPFFGYPFGTAGGGGVFQHATAIDGEAPNFADDAFAAIGTLDVATQQPGPIVVETTVTVNGLAGLSRTTVSGGVFAVSGINFFAP